MGLRSAQRPLSERVRIVQFRLRVGQNAWPINTGRPMPSDANAVIMIEDVHFLDDENFEIEQALVPWQNVRRVGEDFVASEMILPGHHPISAYELGALIAAGVFSLKVVEKPRVLLVPTGSELVSGEALGEREPSESEVLEYNTVMLKGLVEEAGGIGIRTPIVRDDYEVVKAAIVTRRPVRCASHSHKCRLLRGERRLHRGSDKGTW